MENILVLTDFSYNAFNAAKYAVSLANQLNTSRVTLYHSFITASTDVLPAFASEVKDPWIQTIERLYELKSSLEFFCNSTTQIETKIGHTSLELAIEGLSQDKKIGLVVMGSTGNNKLRRLCIGSNAMCMSDACSLPLIIVPPDTDFEQVERAVFVCNLQNTTEVPAQSIKEFMNILHSKLTVLYFDTEAEHTDICLFKQRRALHSLINDINPEYSYIHGEDVVDDIISFSSSHAMQLIIIANEKPRFLQSIFHPHTTNQLAYYSHFPLLILKSDIWSDEDRSQCFVIKNELSNTQPELNDQQQLSYENILIEIFESNKEILTTH